MLDKREFQIGCAFLYEEKIILIDEDNLEILMAVRNYDDYKPIQLTLQILRDNLCFEIHDMGDFWQCELEGFVLIRAKFHLRPDFNIPFVFAFKTTAPRSINFEHVHHLQIVYRSLFNKDLEWKK